MRLQDVRAIVTGAASGLGKHFTLQLARAGALVAAGDIDIKGLEQVKNLSQEMPGRVVTARLDASQEASVTSFVKEAAQQFDGLNALVNSAGILRDGLLASNDGGWIKKLPMAQWKQVLDVNLTGPYLVTREVISKSWHGKLNRVWLSTFPLFPTTETPDNPITQLRRRVWMPVPALGRWNWRVRACAWAQLPRE